VDLLVQLHVPFGDSELAADQLWLVGATAVEVRDVGQTSDGVVLIAGFPTPEAVREAAHRLVAPARADWAVEVVEVVDDSWQDVWKRYAEPVEVGPLVVAPAWRPVPVDAGRVVLTIDPGPCFGSGTHPTTRLLLTELSRHLRPGATVFDVGTGSGILAVAAAHLGADRVVAVDIDPAAVAVADNNMLANGVADRVEVSTRPVTDVGGSFDVVVANLTAAVLAELAGPLVAAVAPGGLVLLSGLLPGQWEHVADRFAALDLLEVPALEGWVGAVLQHR
jgi:ribosomal protein L11 methyltransferase